MFQSFSRNEWKITAGSNFDLHVYDFRLAREVTPKNVIFGQVRSENPAFDLAGVAWSVVRVAEAIDWGLPIISAAWIVALMVWLLYTLFLFAVFVTPQSYRSRLGCYKNAGYEEQYERLHPGYHLKII